MKEWKNLKRKIIEKQNASLPSPLFKQQENSVYSLYILQAGHDNFFIFIWPGIPHQFHFWATNTPPPPPPPPRLHVLTTTCTYVLSWWERERTKIQQQPWALKEKRCTMIDHSNCRWSLSDNPAQNLGCDCWPASLCLACSRLRESREHENKMERKWEEKGLSPFLCPSTAPFSQIIHTHFHLPFTLYDVLMVCYFYDFSEDEQFNDEKTYLIKQIKEL